MSVLVSHPTGNANLRAVLRALEARGALSEFWTALGLPRLAEAPALPETLRRRLGQRRFGEAPWARTHTRPGREAARLLARGLGLGRLVPHETGWASVDGVYRGLDRAVARRLEAPRCRATAVYAYEDGAAASFAAARASGRVCIYDLPIAHWRTLRRLLEEEAARLPDWAPTLQGLRDTAAKHARKDAELALADHVLVASSFTRDSLRGVVGSGPFAPGCPDNDGGSGTDTSTGAGRDRGAVEGTDATDGAGATGGKGHGGDREGRAPGVHVVPYGCPPPPDAEPGCPPFATRAHGAPIELLFAGHLTQRKGLADLIAALDLLTVDWRLTLAGPRPAHVPRALSRLLGDPRCTWLGTVPHSTLLESMARAHVFVFPSIVEGFGMVITEALSRGLPVLTTPHTAGPDLLSEGKDGFVVPIRAPETLAERITVLAEDETRRRSMAAAARVTATRNGWAAYEDRIATLVTGWSGRP